MFGLSETDLMYKEYVKELSKYDLNMAKMDDLDVLHTVSLYKKQSETDWIDIYYNEKIVGFLIVSTNKYEKRSTEDRAICQLYVVPQYRRHGLAKDAVITYLKSHPGIYSYDISDGNNVASNFWYKILKDINAKYIELPEKRSSQESRYLSLNGMVVGKRCAS
ncbi:MAG: GNAT family N-acetyltransferase [Eubacterium sp.]|nr:GNAT family N-acetyltransferase [Eubacterium sp.]